MSGSVPKVFGVTTTVAGVSLLPNTGGSRFVFWAAIAAFAFGAIILLASGVAAFKRRATKA